MLKLMTREPQKPTAFALAELESLQRMLTAWSETTARAIAYVNAKQTDLFVFKAPTLEKGMNCLSQFNEALQESLNAATAGKPYNSDSRKTRIPRSQIKMRAAEKKPRYKRDK